MASQNLSDRNIVERRSIIVSKTRPYSDLDLSLALHPDFNDIIPLTDIDAVKNAVKTLVLTNFNERPFQPQLGANIRGLLFEPADKFTIVALREYIRTVLEQHEPRIDSITIQIRDNSDNNQYDITIGFRVITINVNVDVDLHISRIR